MEPALDTPAQARVLIIRQVRQRLWTYIILRWALVTASLAVLLALDAVADGLRLTGPASFPRAAAILLFMLLYNGVFSILLNRRKDREPNGWLFLAAAPAVLDVCTILALAYVTGDVFSPFLLLILLPVAVLTGTLPLAAAVASGVAVSVLVALLAAMCRMGILPSLADRVPFWPIGLWPFAVAAAAIAVTCLASRTGERLRQLQRDLEAACSRLREEHEIQGFFVRKAGHEMRAPLAAIHSIFDAVAETFHGLSPEQQQLLRRAKQRTKALMGLVSELRRYSRLRMPEAAVEKKPVSLTAVVTDTVELFRQQAEAEGLVLLCHAEPAVVEGDEELLEELAGNLVANAIQYTPRGGKIDVDLTVRAGKALLTVADTGIGISEEGRQRIFEEFYRAPEAKNHFPDGTGLGLTICRRIAEMHGGSISADSPGAGGSVFTVELPLAARA